MKIDVQVMNAVLRPALVVRNGCAWVNRREILIRPNAYADLVSALQELKRLGPVRGHLVYAHFNSSSGFVSQIRPSRGIVVLISTSQDLPRRHDLVACLSVLVVSLRAGSTHIGCDAARHPLTVLAGDTVPSGAFHVAGVTLVQIGVFRPRKFVKNATLIFSKRECSSHRQSRCEPYFEGSHTLCRRIESVRAAFVSIAQNSGHFHVCLVLVEMHAHGETHVAVPHRILIYAVRADDGPNRSVLFNDCRRTAVVARGIRSCARSGIARSARARRTQDDQPFASAARKQRLAANHDLIEKVEVRLADREDRGSYVYLHCIAIFG